MNNLERKKSTSETHTHTCKSYYNCSNRILGMNHRWKEQKKKNENQTAQKSEMSCAKRQIINSI